MKDRAIKLQCPACQRHLKIPELNPKKPIVCPKCNIRFRVDSQQRAWVDTGRKGWFGPSANRAVLNDARLTTPHEIRGAFEDIDHLFPGDKSADRSPSPKTDGSNRNPSVTQSRSEVAGASLGTEVSDRNQTRVQDSAVRWAKENSAMSKSDERLQRNGLGLLILATGLAMLPFVGRHVEGLHAILPYMPLAAAGLAFVGSFMLACSLRRGNLTVVLFSGVPFLLIGLVSLAGYYYQSALGASDPVVDRPPANDPDGMNAADPNDFERNASDEMVIDLNSITDNAASNFVPPRHEKPLAADKKPAIASKPDNIAHAEPENRLTAEKTIDPEPDAHLLDGQHSGDATIAAELKSALEVSLNAEKRIRLQDRIALEMTQGHVSRQTVVSPVDLQERFVLSEVAGEATVYGVAYFLSDPIGGFDVVFSQDGTNQTVESIVPIIDQAEFGDSIVAIREGFALIGLNVSIEPQGVVGLQGLFDNVGDQEKSSSKWAGQEPLDRPATTIEAAGRKVHGIVAYRNQLKIVGIALILDRQSDELK